VIFATFSDFLAGPFGAAIVMLVLLMVVARECVRASGSERAWEIVSGRAAFAVAVVSAVAFWVVVVMRFVAF
jgi:hypothetical protein